MHTHKPEPEDWEQILDSFQGISRAEMPPFFYTRLQARLEPKNQRTGFLWSVLTRPAVTLGTLTLLLILNVAAIRSYLHTQPSAPVQETTGLQTFADEYGLGTSTVYNEKSNR
jgi:hypothetical protein